MRGSKAFYLTSSKKNSEDTALLLQLVSKRDEPEALGSWNRARKLTDCPLLHVHATGEAVLDGQPVAFAVLDLPDDDLSEVLAKRTLDATEAKSTFLSVAAGLDSLHQRGMMHGAVAAPNIFVVKDEMRLSVDNIAPAASAGLRPICGSSAIRWCRRSPAQMRKARSKLWKRHFQRSRPDAAAENGRPRRLSGPSPATNALPGALPHRCTLNRLLRPTETSAARPAAARARARSEARRGFANWLTGPQWTIMGTGILVGLVLLIYLFVHGPRPRHVEITHTPAAATAEPAPAPPAPVVQRPAKPIRVRSGHWAVIAATYYTFKDAQRRSDGYYICSTSYVLLSPYSVAARRTPRS